MQYTIRDVPPPLDAALREAAHRDGTSLNEAAIRAMVRGLGLPSEPASLRDLTDIAGSWLEDAEVDRALADQDRIDAEAW